MNILIAPNSMKGSISAFDFADVAGEAFTNCSPEFDVKKVPVADGGDFTGEVLRRALNAKQKEITVSDPLGRNIRACYGISGKTAIIEMADASGIKLLSGDEPDPLKTSTFGTGQLISDAINSGCTEILLGIGGSATIDGGSGMIEALGFSFTDSEGFPVKGNGGNLIKIERIEKPEQLSGVSFKIICDVDNPLTGKHGAAEVFGPQKGASPEMVSLLDRGLGHWAEILESECGKSLSGLKGAGAAGGIALPLIAYFNAEITPGARFILSVLNFEEYVKWADLVVTGEGKIDFQTLNDKAPKVVADIANKYHKPVIAIGGSVHKEASGAFNGMFSIMNESMTLDEAVTNVRELIYDYFSEMARLLQSLKSK
jgi:glycerate kinase